MPDEFPQPDQFVEGFEPDVEDPLAPDDEFLDIDDTPEREDIVVEEAAPQPLGRSWGYDFIRRRFITVRGKGPLETRGLETLRFWIEKALRTPRGSSVLHPDDYGLPRRNILGESGAEVAFGDLSEDITDCLTFHPRITDVTDFDFNFVEEEEALYASFRVVLDDETGTQDQDLLVEDLALVG